MKIHDRFRPGDRASIRTGNRSGIFRILDIHRNQSGIREGKTIREDWALVEQGPEGPLIRVRLEDLRDPRT